MIFLARWGIIGFITLLIIPKQYFKQSTKLRALLLLFILGPFVWICFPFAIIKVLLNRRD
jgi:hypothetical protein